MDARDPTARAPSGAPTIRTIAMPADTNPAGDIFGGWLLANDRHHGRNRVAGEDGLEEFQRLRHVDAAGARQLVADYEGAILLARIYNDPSYIDAVTRRAIEQLKPTD